MNEYHKIQTVYLRDPATSFKTLLMGEYALPAFQYLARNEWVFTEKVDGTNIRVMLPGYNEDGKAYGVTFGGKTDAAQIPATLVARLEARFHTDEQRAKLAEMFPTGACLYGEGYGAKIQRGGNYRPDQDFVLFDVLVRTTCAHCRANATQSGLTTPRGSANPVTTPGESPLQNTKPHDTTPNGGEEIHRQCATSISGPSSESTLPTTSECSPNKTASAPFADSQRAARGAVEGRSPSPLTTATRPIESEGYSAGHATPPSTKSKSTMSGSTRLLCTCADWWLERHNVEDVAEKLGLDVVPTLGTGTLVEMVALAQEGFDSTWGMFAAEGIVARPACELVARNGHRIITKIKHKDFA